MGRIALHRENVVVLERGGFKMKIKKKNRDVLILALFLCCVIFLFLVLYSRDQVTVKGTVLVVEDGWLIVSLDDMDEKCRVPYRFYQASDFEAGDRVQVTYNGGIDECSPAKLNGVIKVKHLDGTN